MAPTAASTLSGRAAYEEAVRRAIAEHNSDLSLNAWITLGMGIGTTLVVYVVVWVLTWLVGPSWLFGWLPMLAGLAAVGLGFLGVWRGDSPLDGLKPLTDSDLLAITASIAMPNAMVTSPRHLVAGVAEIVLHGPRSILQAVGMLRTRLPDDAALVRAAASVLERGLREDVPLSSVQPPRAAVVLHRLLLLKMQQVGRERFVLTSTIKGQEAVAAAAKR